MQIHKEFTVEACSEGDMIAESFGITGGYVNKIAEIDIPNDWDILYITGESGSGKTTILHEIQKQLNVEDIEITEEMKNKPLFLIGGEDEQSQVKTLKMFTDVGLSDAVLWLNTYEQLSDSQKARFEIAIKMSLSDTVVVDEFLSTLDRETAKPVSYSIQKAVRKAGKKLIVTTAHEDLNDYLQPTYTICGKSFPSRWEISKNDNDFDNKILKNTVVKYGTKEDYRFARLGELHYKGKYTGGAKDYVFAYYNGNMIGVLVAIYNMHTGGRRIARVVVHPSYRGCGVGKTMVQKYIKDYPNTDVVASMALYNPIFEKAGMTRVKDVEIKSPNGLRKKLAEFEFKENKWNDKKYLSDFCKNKDVRNMLSSFSGKATSLVCPAGHYLTDAEIKEKIQNEVFTASRVLFGFRYRKMAKYENVV